MPPWSFGKIRIHENVFIAFHFYTLKMNNHPEYVL